MKKILLIVVAVFSFAIVEAAEISNTVANYTNSETTATAPAVYWSGWARGNNSGKLYIKVYRSANTCDSFYAEATKHEIINLNGPNRSYDINETLAVKNGSRSGRYYVTYDGIDYYFSM